MDNFITHIVSITILIFLLITFLQSGIDKLTDWKGNLQWLQGHFAKTFMGNMVPLLLGIVLILEIVTALYSIAGIYDLIANNATNTGTIAMFLGCITLLMLLFGQRVAKDYQGALTITCYFIVAIFGLYVITSPGIKVYVMSSLKRNPVRFSRHIAKFTYYSKTENDKEWIQNISALVQQHEIDVVMPIFEKGIQRIIENKKDLDPSVRLALLPNQEVFSIAINKWHFSQYCMKYSFPVPKGFVQRPDSDQATNKSLLSNLKFPVIVKPQEGFGGGMGVEVFSNLKDTLAYFTQKLTYPVIIQEFVSGYDIDCSILAKNGKIIAYTIQKGFLQGKSPYAPQVGITFIENKKVLEVVTQLINHLQWDGVAHLDLRYDQESDTYKIIELNPRFWGSIDAACRMGVNFPELLIRKTLGYDIEVPKPKYEDYYNLKGLSKKIRKNPFFFARLQFIKNAR